MKRHPSLAPLSRDHHHALVLARDAARGSIEAREVRARFERELAPHFEVEERVLVPRCEAFGEPLASQAARVVDDHEAIRAILTPTVGDAARLAELGELLEAHVRFEERTWFPALEEHLGQAALERLASSLRPAPPSEIRGFHRDEAGDWIAELACGHTQHVRHRPPFERRAWVTSEEGRAARIGQALPCVYCRMPRLPEGVIEYKRTNVFDEHSVPAGLTRSHSLKAGAWGEIVVTRGRVLYVLEDDGDWGVVLRPGMSGIVAPERPHHVELEAGAAFFVRFLAEPRQKPEGAV